MRAKERVALTSISMRFVSGKVRPGRGGVRSLSVRKGLEMKCVLARGGGHDVYSNLFLDIMNNTIQGKDLWHTVVCDLRLIPCTL